MTKRFLLYGAFGIFLEILWTSINSCISGDLTFTGHSSLIMFFIYGMVLFLEPLFELFSHQYTFVRIVTYSMFIFSMEYFSGIFLTKLSMCPWFYDGKYNISNVIRLDYIILWMAAGYVYERLYFYFSSHNL